MKRLACGTGAFVVLFGLSACFSDPGKAINNGNFHTVQASPTVSVLNVGDSDQILLRLVNDANNAVSTEFNIINPNPNGIAVHYTPDYRNAFFGGSDTLVQVPDKAQQQYYVVGLAAGDYEFMAVPTYNTADTGVVTVHVIAP
jgi:hypothetical protein